MPGKTSKAFAAVAIVVTLALPQGPFAPFTTHLPGAIPALEGWERMTGEAEFEDRAVQYELYVNPRRGYLYEVVRYRVTPRGERPGAEKLHWHAGQAVVRRWACDSPSGGGECQWRELAKGTAEYIDELGVVTWIYGVHRRLLELRDRGELSR